jgi:hypothetical protein
MNNWQPLETAPKDKTVIVAFLTQFFGKLIPESRYGYFDTDSGEWLFNDPYGDWRQRVIHQPIGWMPCPELPESW